MALMLKQLREAAGMTQKEVASAIGGSYRAIQSWESGKTYPDANKVWELATLFHTDPNTLLGWNEAHPCEITHQDPYEKELVCCYRDSTTQRKASILQTARDAAGMSRDSAEYTAHESEGLKAI